MAMDRSGHRLAGPAVSMGAKYFDADGKPSLLKDAGFRAMAQMMVQWHKDGVWKSGLVPAVVMPTPRDCS
jgi:alpha-1,4-digalacturonate transport system substrate-binding protein